MGAQEPVSGVTISSGQVNALWYTEGNGVFLIAFSCCHDHDEASDAGAVSGWAAGPAIARSAMPALPYGQDGMTGHAESPAAGWYRSGVDEC